MRWRHPRPRLGFALVLLLGMLSLGITSPRNADAVLTTTTSCGSIGSAPIASTSSFECDYVTQQPLVPAANPPANATLTLTIVNPSGTVFTGAGFTTPPPPPGQPILPPPPCLINPAGAVLTVTCSYTAGTNGLPIGTVFYLALTGGNTAGMITMTATYTNPPGPISISPPVPPFAYQFDTSVGNSSVTTFFNTAAPTGVTCIGPAAQIAVGNSLTCTVTYPTSPDQTPSFVTVTGNTIAAVGNGPTQNTRTSGNATGFLCGNPVTNVACSSFTFTGTAAGIGQPSFTITSYAIGAVTPYSTTTLSPAITIGPGTNGTAPQTPVAGTCGSAAAAAIATGSTFECDYLTQMAITPSAIGSSILVLTITGPSGTTFFGNGFVGGTSPFGCTSVVSPTTTLTLTCPPGFPGVPSGIVTPPTLPPSGSVLPLSLFGGSPGSSPGPITLTATYSPPGSPSSTLPVPPFTYRFDGPPNGFIGPASVTTATGIAAPTGVICTNTTFGQTPSAGLVVGSSFSCTISFSPSQTPSFVTVAGTQTGGNVPSPVNPGPVTNPRPLLIGGTGNPSGFYCGNPITNTACTSVTFTGTAAAAGVPSFSVVLYAIGATNPYSTTTLTPGLAAIVVPTGPVLAALGCANAVQPTDIAFHAVPLSAANQFGPELLASSTQFASSPPLSGKATVPAILSTVAPTVVALCGAVFQDSGRFVSDADQNPNTIDAGTIAYTVNSPLAVITESGSSTYMVTCGDLDPIPPVSNNSYNSAVSAPAFSSPPVTPAFISPVPANLIHVALVPGATFALLGSTRAFITVSATYSRVAVPGSPPLTLTTNTATITVLPPPYRMSLAASPGQVGASGTGAGSTITATLIHPSVLGCVPLTTGSFVICAGAPTLFFNTPSAGSEPGLVTFRTNAGVLGNPNDPSTSASQLEYSVHCGPIQQPSVIITATPFDISSCASVSVVLYGAGASGTATIAASFIGDVTGSTTNAIVTIQLLASGPPVPLTRGCNQVITPSNIAANTPVSQLAALAQPSNIVISIFQFNNAAKIFFAGYFNTPGAPVDFNTVGPNQSVFICVSGPGTFPSGAL